MYQLAMCTLLFSPSPNQPSKHCSLTIKKIYGVILYEYKGHSLNTDQVFKNTCFNENCGFTEDDRKVFCVLLCRCLQLISGLSSCHCCLITAQNCVEIQLSSYKIDPEYHL